VPGSENRPKFEKDTTDRQCVESTTGDETSNSCTGTKDIAEKAAKNIQKKATSDAVKADEEDAATASDTLKLKGTKEKVAETPGSNNPYSNVVSNLKADLLDAIKVGAHVPEPSNVTVPTLHTEKTNGEGAAIKEAPVKKPCAAN
jgi:hypothetical protein